MFHSGPPVLLIQKYIFGDAIQVVVVKSLRQVVLNLSDHPLISGHHWQRRMYDSLQSMRYQKHMSHDLCFTLTQLAGFVRNGSWSRHRRRLKLLPTFGPALNCPSDCLCSFVEDSECSWYISVVTGKQFKFVRAHLAITTSSAQVPNVFRDHWIVPFEKWPYLLKENSPESMNKFFQSGSGYRDMKALTTTSLYPKKHDQANQFKSVVTNLWKYVPENQNSWDLFVQTSTYVYITQAHKSKNMSPFSLMLS